MTTGDFLNRQTPVPSRRSGVARRREELFAAITWNAKTPMTFLRLSVDQVAELGGQVDF